MQIEKEIIDLIAKCAVISFSAVVTVRLSLRSFYTQKWWERKAEAYSNIIRALAEIKFIYVEWEADFLGEKNIPDEKIKLLKQSEDKAEETLRIILNTSTFLLSNDTKLRLEQFIKHYDKADNGHDYYSYIDDGFGITNKCIDDIINLAKKDLKTK